MMSINVSLAPKWLATAMACGSPWRGARPKSVANRNVRCFEGALGKLFFGSVAEEIFRQADACAEASEKSVAINTDRGLRAAAMTDMGEPNAALASLEKPSDEVWAT